MATLRDYFTLDFSRWMTSSREATAAPSSSQAIQFPVRLHKDFEVNGKFISIYVPPELHPVPTAKHFVDNIDVPLSFGDGLGVLSSFGELPAQLSSETLVFTGRMFVYAEQSIPENEIEEFRIYCSAKNLHLVWYDTHYAIERSKLDRPKAFICHDSRDKKEIAEKIAIGLQKVLFPVWYDAFSLSVGDSLRGSIEKGIKEAGKCILILSPDFLSNEGWTKAEYDSIFTREMIEKRRVILPVWHNVTREQVYNYSPRLADCVALNTSGGIEAVVARLHAKLAAAD